MTHFQELLNLRDRLSLITGAAGTLGQVFSISLAALGSNLILIDKDELALLNLVREIKNEFAIDVNYFVCDLEKIESRNEMIDHVEKLSNKLDILVNNAAFVGNSNLSGWSVPFMEQSIETWQRALEVNLTAVFQLCQNLYPLLRSSGNGSIINISSIYGVVGVDWNLYRGTLMANPAAYSASKGALIQLTKWLATTMAPEVRVNAISPGGIFNNQDPKFVKRYEEKTPLGRMAKPDDFKGAIAFLATDLSRYLTGQNLIIDGGFSSW